jgi:hypothetical protein
MLPPAFRELRDSPPPSTPCPRRPRDPIPSRPSCRPALLHFRSLISTLAAVSNHARSRTRASLPLGSRSSPESCKPFRLAPTAQPPASAHISVSPLRPPCRGTRRPALFRFRASPRPRKPSRSAPRPTAARRCARNLARPSLLAPRQDSCKPFGPARTAQPPASAHPSLLAPRQDSCKPFRPARAAQPPASAHLSAFLRAQACPVHSRNLAPPHPSSAGRRRAARKRVASVARMPRKELLHDSNSPHPRAPPLEHIRRPAPFRFHASPRPRKPSRAAPRPTAARRCARNLARPSVLSPRAMLPARVAFPRVRKLLSAIPAVPNHHRSRVPASSRLSYTAAISRLAASGFRCFLDAPFRP